MSYWRVYNTYEETYDAERIGFLHALGVVANLDNTTKIYNFRTGEYAEVSDVTVQYIKDNPNDFGFPSYHITTGKMNPHLIIFTAGEIQQIDKGEYAGKWAIAVLDLYIEMGYDLVVPEPLASLNGVSHRDLFNGDYDG
jgi:hypothetical protein